MWLLRLNREVEWKFKRRRRRKNGCCIDVSIMTDRCMRYRRPCHEWFNNNSILPRRITNFFFVDVFFLLFLGLSFLFETISGSQRGPSVPIRIAWQALDRVVVHANTDHTNHLRSEQPKNVIACNYDTKKKYKNDSVARCEACESEWRAIACSCMCMTRIPKPESKHKKSMRKAVSNGPTSNMF